MFTLEQIKAAHSKVKSGADFPAYIQDIIALGVNSYTTYVADGRTDYLGLNDFQISSPSNYDSIEIADKSFMSQFKVDLKAHQQKKTDFKTFCKDCAKSGIAYWIVCTDKMTCTYYDKKGNEVLVEIIPH